MLYTSHSIRELRANSQVKVIKGPVNLIKHSAHFNKSDAFTANVDDASIVLMIM